MNVHNLAIPPRREQTYLILSSYVPHSEADILVFHGFHIEANGGDGSDDLTELELVEDGSLRPRIYLNVSSSPNDCPRAVAPLVSPSL